MNLGLEKHGFELGASVLDGVTSVGEYDLTTRQQKIVLTGGPASGKSTAIEYLRHKGYNVIPEAARDVLCVYKEPGPKTQQLIFLRQLEYELGHSVDGLNILDRSLLDAAAYSKLFGSPLPPNFEDVVQRSSYHSQVILLNVPPTEEIYEKMARDGLRFESFEVAKQLEGLLIDAYQSRGYVVHHLPWTQTKQERQEKLVGLLEEIVGKK
jgi:predicted ATPase